MWSKETKEDPFAGFEMTHESLKKLCKQHKLYTSCPELNEIMHLHQKGITKIKNLDKYINLRTIYFECNAISTIESLDHLVNLRCLYLNENLVEFITGLDNLKNLETLDLADNQIKTIQGLSNCTQLRQLNLSGNRIQSAGDVHHLMECPTLQSLDLSKNRIDDELALEAEQEMRDTIRHEDTVTRERHRKEFDDMINKAKAEAAARQQQAEEETQKGLKEAAPEVHMVKKDTNEEFSCVENMEEDEDMPPLEKIAVDPRKRDANELQSEEYQSPRRHWRGVEFIGSGVDLPITSPMDMQIGLQACARFIDQNQESESSEASSVFPDNTISEPYDDTRYKSYSGVAALMGESEGLLELCAVDKPHSEETVFRVSESLEDSSFDWEAYKAPFDPDEMNKIAVQESQRQFEWIERERAFKRELQERVLRRAAVNADTMLERAKKHIIQGPPNSSDINADGLQHGRPIIWGTNAYRNLWEKAAEVADPVESDLKSESSIEEKISDQEDHDLSEQTDMVMDMLLSANESVTSIGLSEQTQYFQNPIFDKDPDSFDELQPVP
ncbi:hypothetical protein R1sor_014890 [Riccia sorocarpa]|uniref:Dynein assembly factor 1, axonemal homolog n=1 Tax=Riccia sorocarpa TaxID=122646 RepID=A0ABD3HCI6_9MARC